MATQIIENVELSEVMQSSYINYAMSVITDRALPDSRDGLKPVQRRVLYSMKELGTTPDKPHRKCARIVGDAMGKYHPHGDSSIYEALVNLAQEWKTTPLVDGHGNFGSLEGDGAAAMRYTEARLSKLAMLFLKDIDKVVDYVPNFDGTEKEPVVLPVQYPNLLVNGSEGIAVGMAGKIPPHNLGEVIDGTIALLQQPKLTTEDLMRYIPGPDFPTGGIITNPDDLRTVYETGSGKLRIRGKAEIVHEKGHDVIVIRELPPTLIGRIPQFINRISELYQNKQLPDIADISNMTSTEVDIHIPIKRGGDAKETLNILHKKAGLEDTYSVNMLAVVDKKPKTLSLKEALMCWIQYTFEVNTRKYTYLKQKEEEALEVKEGLIEAVDCIDLIIEILRGSKTVAVAKECLISGDTSKVKFRLKESERSAKKLHFTERQADAILAMRLSRLIGLEILQLQKEKKECEKNIQRYTLLLTSPKKMRDTIIADLISVKEQFATPRRTTIQAMEAITLQKAVIKEMPVVIVVNRFGYVKCMEEDTFQKSSGQESYRYIIHTTNMDRLLIFTDRGVVHQIKVLDIPICTAKDKGVPLENISNLATEEIPLYIGAFNCLETMVFVSSDGFIKTVDPVEFDTSRKTTFATKVNEGETLVYCGRADSDLVLATKNGFFVRIKAEEIPVYKKTAIGCKGIQLGSGDAVITALSGTTKDSIEYQGKEVEFLRIKTSKRGGKGIKLRL